MDGAAATATAAAAAAAAAVGAPVAAAVPGSQGPASKPAHLTPDTPGLLGIADTVAAAWPELRDGESWPCSVVHKCFETGPSQMPSGTASAAAGLDLGANKPSAFAACANARQGPVVVDAEPVPAEAAGWTLNEGRATGQPVGFSSTQSSAFSRMRSPPRYGAAAAGRVRLEAVRLAPATASWPGEDPPSPPPPPPSPPPPPPPSHPPPPLCSTARAVAATVPTYPLGTGLSEANWRKVAHNASQKVRLGCLRRADSGMTVAKAELVALLHLSRMDAASAIPCGLTAFKSMCRCVPHASSRFAVFLC